MSVVEEKRSRGASGLFPVFVPKDKQAGKKCSAKIKQSKRRREIDEFPC